MLSPIFFLLCGGIITILIEGTVLWFGLGRRYSTGEKLFFAVWLTAATYPVVVLVLPSLMSTSEPRSAYLFAAESFAIIGECALFTIGSVRLDKSVYFKELGVIVIANLISFAGGEFYFRLLA